MKIGTINNSVNEEFRRVITWQYDNAYRLISLIYMIQTMYKASIEDPWDLFVNKFMNMYSLSAFGTSLWSVNLGMTHPTYEDAETGTTPISTDYYGRLLSGRMLLLPSRYSMYDITKFLEKVYGGRVKVKDYNDDQSLSPMTLYFTASSADLSAEELYLLTNNPSVALCHPAGVGVSFTLT